MKTSDGTTWFTVNSNTNAEGLSYHNEGFGFQHYEQRLQKQHTGSLRRETIMYDRIMNDEQEVSFRYEKKFTTKNDKSFRIKEIADCTVEELTSNDYSRAKLVIKSDANSTVFESSNE